MWCQAKQRREIDGLNKAAAQQQKFITLSGLCETQTKGEGTRIQGWVQGQIWGVGPGVGGVRGEARGGVKTG